MKAERSVGVCHVMELDDRAQLAIESIRRGFAEIEAGHYIPHQAMRAWLLSLGSNHELPPPKCVCGELHDERWNIQERKDAP
jgi:hypothetical protein